ncbi:MAG: phosphomethylpyrimidine synthase ThiC [Candidatus Hydrogenedentota bacterium]
MNKDTLINLLRKKEIIGTVKKVARTEGIEVPELADLILNSRVVIPCNILNRDRLKVCGIGEKLRVKINANIGTSPDCHNLDVEIAKARTAVKYGSDTLMDLSIGGDVYKILKGIRETVDIPLGTVPVYTASVKAKEKYGVSSKITEDDLFESVERHCEIGVDFITVHCGVTRKVLEILKNKKRILNIVSRGGALLANFMLKNDCENPFYEKFDRLLDIAACYDVTLSLGDGLRPGCIEDATDTPQIEEMIVLSQLAKRAATRGVQVMIEGPGHIPLNEIETNIKIQKSLCNGAPFYVLGPLVTDVAVGYDHIASAIGSALAGLAGADFLCYVTPAEHLGLPTIEDVKTGVIASKIAAHSVNIARGFKDARERDRLMAIARQKLDWEKQFELAFDQEIPKEKRNKILPVDEELCSMCGEYCAILASKNL